MKRSIHKSNYISFLVSPRLRSTCAIALPSENLGNAKSMRLGKNQIFIAQGHMLFVASEPGWPEGKCLKKLILGMSVLSTLYYSLCPFVSCIAPKLLLDIPKFITSNKNYTSMYHCPPSYICKVFAIVLTGNHNVFWRTSLPFLAQSYLKPPTHQCLWEQGTCVGWADLLCSLGLGVKLAALPLLAVWEISLNSNELQLTIWFFWLLHIRKCRSVGSMHVTFRSCWVSL